MSHTISDRESDTPEEFISRFTDKYPRISKKLWGESLLFEMKPEISWSSRAAKLELSDRLIWDFSLLQIFEIALVLLFPQSFMIPLWCRTIESIYISSCIGFLFLEVCLELDSCLLGEYPYRFTEFDLLHLHDKFDRTTSLPTRETVSDIFLWRDDKWRGLLRVKRAECLIVHSCLLHIYIPPDDIEDTDSRFDVLGERQEK